MIPRKNIRVLREHEDRGGMACTQCRIAAVIVLSQFENINPISAQHMIPRKNIRVLREHEDRGGMACTQCRIAAVIVLSQSRRGNFQNDFFMILLGFKD